MPGRHFKGLCMRGNANSMCTQLLGFADFLPLSFLEAGGRLAGRAATGAQPTGQQMEKCHMYMFIYIYIILYYIYLIFVDIYIYIYIYIPYESLDWPKYTKSTNKCHLKLFNVSISLNTYIVFEFIFCPKGACCRMQELGDPK